MGELLLCEGREVKIMRWRESYVNRRSTNIYNRMATEAGICRCLHNLVRGPEMDHHFSGASDHRRLPDSASKRVESFYLQYVLHSWNHGLRASILSCCRLMAVMSAG